MEPGFRRTPITAISSIGQKDNSTDGSVANETGHCHLIFCESPERVEMKTVSDSKTLNDRGWDPSEAAMSLTLRLGLQLRAILCTYVSFMVYPVIRANSQCCPYEHLAAWTRYHLSYCCVRRLCCLHQHWQISHLMGHIEYLAQSDCAFDVTLNRSSSTQLRPQCFDSFLRAIECCDSLLDAQRLKNDIDTEIRKTQMLLGS